MSGSVSAPFRAVSSASRALDEVCRLSSADTPSRRTEACAARPGTVSLNVIAPAWAMTMSRPVGSVMIATSPVDARPGWRRASPARRPPRTGTLATRISPAEPVGEPGRDERPNGAEDRGDAALHVAPRRDRRARSPLPLAGPRVVRPGRGIADGHDVDVTDEDDPPPARLAEAPEHDREAVARHLLARPVGVGADRRPDPARAARRGSRPLPAARPRGPGPRPRRR